MAPVPSTSMRRYPENVRLDFKFRESSPPAERKRVIKRVKKLGAKKVEAMFPDEKDAGLASLYKAEGIPEEQSSEVISTLSELAEVEYAEPTPMRELIR